MALPCYNSICAAEHAHEAGEQTRREIWEGQKRAEIEQRLENGGSVCIGHAEYDRADILAESMGREEMLMLHNWMKSGDETDLKIFAERVEQIVIAWLDKHINDILAVEYGHSA